MQSLNTRSSLTSDVIIPRRELPNLYDPMSKKSATKKKKVLSQFDLQEGGEIHSTIFLEVPTFDRVAPESSQYHKIRESTTGLPCCSPPPPILLIHATQQATVEVVIPLIASDATENPQTFLWIILCLNLQ